MTGPATINGRCTIRSKNPANSKCAIYVAYVIACANYWISRLATDGYVGVRLTVTSGVLQETKNAHGKVQENVGAGRVSPLSSIVLG